MAQNTFTDGFLQQDYSVNYDDIEPMSYFLFQLKRGTKNRAGLVPVFTNHQMNFFSTAELS